MLNPRYRAARTATSLGLAVLGLATACDRAPDAEASRTHADSPASAFHLESDDRFAFLLGPCSRPEPFTADTTDLLPTTVAKLAQSEPVVASRAREDLIAAGRSAVPELRRAFQRQYSEPGRAPRLLALLELASLAGGPEARAMGLEGLQHPSEVVCAAAARALSSSSEAADYDAIALRIPHGGKEFAKLAGLALLHADEQRVLADYPGWIEQPGYSRLLDPIAPIVAAKAGPELRARVLAHEALPPTARTWFLAAQAADGDDEAEAQLRAGADVPGRRVEVIRTALTAGVDMAVFGVTTADPDPTVRTLLLESAAAQPDSPAAREEIAAGLADHDPDVRSTALTLLAGRGDPEALDRAIELLAGTGDDLTYALHALRRPMAADPKIAERVLARLEELLDGGARSGGLAIERAIGQVPLARAARILIERGRATGGTIQDLPAHRWYAIQAGNAGAEGRAWLRSQWDVEEDPVRRLDLLSAGVQEKSADATAFLARVLESGRALDMERLLAADLLARTSPMAEAAPLLKPASMRIEDARLRRAFFCLLWRYYGPES